MQPHPRLRVGEEWPYRALSCVKRPCSRIRDCMRDSMCDNCTVRDRVAADRVAADALKSVPTVRR